MPTRPSIHSLPDSTSSALHHYPTPVHHLYPLFAGLIFHVIPAKLEDDLTKIYECVDALGGKCDGLEGAKIVVTGLRGRARLVRAIGKDWVDEKPIVGVEYIWDTFQRCLESASQSDEGVPPKLPPRDQYYVQAQPPDFRKRRNSASDEESPNPKKRRINGDGEGMVGRKMIDYLPDIEMYDEDIKLKDIPRLCVERPSPLVCVNQDIIEAIKPIYEDREFEEREQKNSNVLSYRRSMGMLKSCPRRIRSGKDARRMADVGEKVAERIDEYLQTGKIAITEGILASSRHHALKLFASVYSIGHTKSKELYEKYGCRELADVRRHYMDIAEESEEVRLKEKVRRRKGGGMSQVDIVEEWMLLKDELDAKIPRDEVEEIATCVMEHLTAFLPGCSYTITGGYRRGKPQSNDVDVVFCPPKEGQDIGLLKDLYTRLASLDIITHVLYVTHRDVRSVIKSSANNFDNLDKAFVIFKLPGKGRLHRRVDLISAPKERYAAAVLSWSGSMMFERDLRRYVENVRGLKFKAGLVEPNTGKEIHLATEREIFHYIGLRYVPPELRNADG